MAHAILGAATSYTTGQDISIGALSAVSSEAAALPYLSSYLAKIQKNSPKMKKTPSPTSSP